MGMQACKQETASKGTRMHHAGQAPAPPLHKLLEVRTPDVPHVWVLEQRDTPLVHLEALLPELVLLETARATCNLFSWKQQLVLLETATCSPGNSNLFSWKQNLFSWEHAFSWKQNLFSWKHAFSWKQQLVLLETAPCTVFSWKQHRAPCSPGNSTVHRVLLETAPCTVFSWKQHVHHASIGCRTLGAATALGPCVFDTGASSPQVGCSSGWCARVLGSSSQHPWVRAVAQRV